MPGEAVDPVPLSLSGPVHNRCMGGVEAGRRRARFHRGRRAGRRGVQILPRRSIEKRTGGSLLLSQIVHECLHGRGAHDFAENIENFETTGASVIGLSGDKIEVQRDFSTKECRDKFPVGADPSFSVIKAYDAAFNIPIVGAAFANRISYVISPEGKILYAYSDSNAEKHIENTLAVVRKWREEHKR